MGRKKGPDAATGDAHQLVDEGAKVVSTKRAEAEKEARMAKLSRPAHRKKRTWLGVLAVMGALGGDCDSNEPGCNGAELVDHVGESFTSWEDFKYGALSFPTNIVDFVRSAKATVGGYSEEAQQLLDQEGQ